MQFKALSEYVSLMKMQTILIVPINSAKFRNTKSKLKLRLTNILTESLFHLVFVFNSKNLKILCQNVL